MKKGKAKIEFEANRANLEFTLRSLWRDGAIEEDMCWRLLRRVWDAKTTGQLARVAGELAGIVKAKQGERSKEEG